MSEGTKDLTVREGGRSGSGLAGLARLMVAGVVLVSMSAPYYMRTLVQRALSTIEGKMPSSFQLDAKIEALDDAEKGIDRVMKSVQENIPTYGEELKKVNDSLKAVDFKLTTYSKALQNPNLGELSDQQMRLVQSELQQLEEYRKRLVERRIVLEAAIEHGESTYQKLRGDAVKAHDEIEATRLQLAVDYARSAIRSTETGNQRDRSVPDWMQVELEGIEIPDFLRLDRGTDKGPISVDLLKEEVERIQEG
jgi:hypothetical protein